MLTLDDIQAASLDIRWEPDLYGAFPGGARVRPMFVFFNGVCADAIVTHGLQSKSHLWVYNIFGAISPNPQIFFQTAEAAMRAAQGVLHALGRI